MLLAILDQESCCRSVPNPSLEIDFDPGRSRDGASSVGIYAEGPLGDSGEFIGERETVFGEEGKVREVKSNEATDDFSGLLGSNGAGTKDAGTLPDHPGNASKQLKIALNAFGEELFEILRQSGIVCKVGGHSSGRFCRRTLRASDSC